MSRRNSIEPSSPMQHLWKPELYKIQLEAPIPKPLYCKQAAQRHVAADLPFCYGKVYHGRMNHQEAEQLLAQTEDGTYLLRSSPNAKDYTTLSVRFNKRVKHFKIYYNAGEGHFLKDQNKHFATINELVADGLINFHMQLHASHILQQINQQSLQHNYQQSPYMTLNGRKLRALSKELQRSQSETQALAAELEQKVAVKRALCAVNNDELEQNMPTQQCKRVEDKIHISYAVKNVELAPLLPLEKSHNFKLHNFKGFNWCELCANFLWGFTAQGVKCEDCGFMAHSRCSEVVPPNCVPDLKRCRGIFGTDLTTIVQLQKCQIPFVVRRCVEEVEARGMLQEGIYRVSGFQDEIEALKMALDRDGDRTDMSETTYGNVNVIAGTLKLYLRLLPVPLITFQAYPSFMEASKSFNDAQHLPKMSAAAKKLPLAHYNCLKFMMEHLKKVASHYAANKMNEHNLATVFAPTLIATPQHMINLTEEIYMLSTLITHCETIFS